MDEVRGGVVSLGIVAAGSLHLRHKGAVDISRQLVHEMNDEVVFFLGVEDGYASAGCSEGSCVTDLATAFGVEWGGVEDNLVELLVFRLDFAVP